MVNFLPKLPGFRLALAAGLALDGRNAQAKLIR
jgi:hypothetical protein